MSEASFTILKLVLSICTVVITAYVVPFIKQKISDKKYEKLVQFVQTAVEAAEQEIKGTGLGKEKKLRVVEFAKDYLNEHGIDISGDQLNDLIEAIVYEMNRSYI